MKTTERKQFDDWGEAFDLCRELDRPITVELVASNYVEADEAGTWKLFPSGRAERKS
jgi:hypothetical protein